MTSVPVHDETWRDRAACRNADPAVFHPTEKNTNCLPAAQALCDSCPVRAGCLAAALRDRDVHGFRAGHTGAERQALLVKPVKPDVTDVILRLHAKRWTTPAIALRLGVDNQTVWRTLKAHREGSAA